MPYTNIKPGTLLAPVPAVMVSCADQNTVSRPNIITIAWAGTVNSEPPMVSISVRKERYSHDIIRDSGEFVINLCGKPQLNALDLCGVKSGRDLDKFALCGLKPVPAEGLTYAPAIEGCPIYLGCKVKNMIELGSHDMFIGEIVSLGIDPALMDETGRIDFAKADLVAYNHGVYYSLGEILGFFGCSVAAPEVYEKRMAALGVEKR